MKRLSLEDHVARAAGKLLLLEDPEPRGAALNMALDEALLRTSAAATADGAPAAILRLYRWRQPAVSFGYFQPWAEIRARFPDRELVRRWTGGGVVEHGEGVDWTYSFLVPRNTRTAGVADRSLPPAETYRRIHGALAQAFEAAGWSGARLCIEAETGALNPGCPSDRASACFVAAPVLNDVLMTGRKVAGAAQRRTRTGLLHQGSVQNPEMDLRDVARRARLAAAFAAALAEGAAVIVGREIPAKILVEAEALAERKYGAITWQEKF